MQPFFSIIVPVYNVAPYLRECLDSVLSQTFTDWECLCVDDGSTDGSGAILDEYAAKAPRFRVFHQPNAGVSAARNLALDNAKGEWVWFVDGDDAIARCALQLLHEKLQLFPDAKAITLESAEERVDLANAFTSIAQTKNCQFIAEQIDDGILDFSRTAWNILFHRATIASLRFRSYRLGEDGLFALEYYCKIKKWLKTDFKLYFYRERATSVCHEKITVDVAMEWLRSFRARFYMLTSQNEISMGGGKDLFEIRCMGLLVLPWQSLITRKGRCRSSLSIVAFTQLCGQCICSIQFQTPLNSGLINVYPISMVDVDARYKNRSSAHSTRFVASSPFQITFRYFSIQALTTSEQEVA